MHHFSYDADSLVNNGVPLFTTPDDPYMFRVEALDRYDTAAGTLSSLDVVDTTKAEENTHGDEYGSAGAREWLAPADLWVSTAVGVSTQHFVRGQSFGKNLNESGTGVLPPRGHRVTPAS